MLVSLNGLHLNETIMTPEIIEAASFLPGKVKP